MTQPHAVLTDVAAPRRSGGTAPASRAWLRCLPPAYSPITLDAIVRAAMATTAGNDERPALRDALARDYAAQNVALLDSGTHALHVGLCIAARLASGRPAVALPAYACYDVATAAVATGFDLMLYDVVPHTLEPDLDSLDDALHRGARVVVVAPLYGGAARWDAIHTAAERAGAVVVEDAAQGHGSAWRGISAGCHTSIGVLSFGRGKGWTGGAGGALLLRGPAAKAYDPEIDEPPVHAASNRVIIRAAAMRTFNAPSRFGMAAALPWLHLGETRYHRPETPRGMARASAALLNATRAAADVEANARRAAGSYYRRALVATPGVSPLLPVPHTNAGDLRFAVRVAHGMRGFVDRSRARALGVAASYPTSLRELLPVRERLAASERPPLMCGADVLSRQLITLPTHSLATSRDRRAIVGLLDRYPSPLDEVR